MKRTVLRKALGCATALVLLGAPAASAAPSETGAVTCIKPFWCLTDG